MDQVTIKGVSGVLYFLGTPVGVAPIINDVSKGGTIASVIATLQAVVGFADVINTFSKYAPQAGIVLGVAALINDTDSIITSYNEADKVVEVSDIYSAFADVATITASVATFTVVGVAGSTIAPILIATAVVATVAGAVLTLAAMGAGDNDETLDLKPYIDTLLKSYNELAEVLGDDYSNAINAFAEVLDKSLSYTIALGEYVEDAMGEVREIFLDGGNKVLIGFDKLIGELNGLFGSAISTMSPLVLDLDGDGIDTLSVGSGIYFDHGGDGFSESSGWIGRGDGFLVYDVNHDGIINSGRELFGNNFVLENGKNAANGFEALSEFDSNKDGVVDESDERFDQLKIWRDQNSNAKVDAGELLALEGVGVVGLNVAFASQDVIDVHGNRVMQLGSYVSSDGTSKIVEGIWFAVNYSDTAQAGSIEGACSKVFPEVPGSGRVLSLSQSIIQDETGALSALIERFSTETSSEARKLIVNDVIFSWSGVDKYSAISRGGFVDDGRKIYALEAFLDKEFLQSSGTNEGTGNPGPNSSALLMVGYEKLADFVNSSLMLQTHLKPLMDSLDFRFESGELVIDATGLIGLLRSEYYNDVSVGTELISNLSHSLKVAAGGAGKEILSVISSFGNAKANAFDMLLVAMGGVLGASGDDKIYGTISADLLLGLDGDDIIYGDSGNDTVEGGLGRDYLSGGSGSDVYRFSKGWGHDTLNNYDLGTNKVDAIEFGEGIAVADISVTRLRDDLLLSFKDGLDTVTVANYFYNDLISGYVLEEVRFDSGAVWGVQQIKALTLLPSDSNDTIYGYSVADLMDGRAGNDFLYGKGGDDIILGGAGDDWLEGGVGEDQYLLSLGDGKDTIVEEIGVRGEIDKVRFGEGVDSSVVVLSVINNDLKLKYSASGDEVTFKNWFLWSGNNYKVEEILFADGAVWTSSMLTDLALSYHGTSENDTYIGTSITPGQFIFGGAGNDILTGGKNNDQITGGTGNDLLTGGEGSDLYLFNLGDGQDTITENSNYSIGNIDTLRFGAGIQATDIAVNASGSDMVFSHVNGRDKITVKGWFAQDSGRYQLERVEFADGTNWTGSVLTTQALNYNGTSANDVYNGSSIASKQIIAGGAGNDTLTGGTNNDQITGGTGNDLLTGGEGSDLYLFNLGDGQDTITENSNYSIGNIDTLRFGAGIQATDIAVNASGSDMVFSHVNGRDKITVKGWFAQDSGRYQLERVEFADGTNWTGSVLTTQALNYNGTSANDVYNGISIASKQIIAGGAGNDTLTGGTNNDQITGGTGNDLLTGGEGSDLYLFNLGDGQDTITENSNYSIGNIDTLWFGAGIQATDIAVNASGSDMVFSHVNGSDKITIKGWFAQDSGRYQLEHVEFLEGGLWSSQDMKVMTAKYTQLDQVNILLLGQGDFSLE